MLVIQPDADDPLDMFEDWFADEGLTVQTVKPFEGQAIPQHVQTSGLVVLGGDMGVHDEGAHPWLLDIQILLADAVRSEAPTLGICLGSQLLAAACGGVIELGSRGMEVGTPTITLRPEAHDDELLGDLVWPSIFPSMHRDEIRILPPGAPWLAESDMYKHQAFRVGRRAWGVQFHPEVSVGRFTSWSDHKEEDPTTVERIDRGVSQYAATADQVKVHAEPLARRFAQITIQAAITRLASHQSQTRF